MHCDKKLRLSLMHTWITAEKMVLASLFSILTISISQSQKTFVFDKPVRFNEQPQPTHLLEYFESILQGYSVLAMYHEASLECNS